MYLTQLYKTFSGQKSIYPFYHAVSNRRALHLKHLYNVRSCALFEQDLEFFLQNYQSISLSEILTKRSKASFHITFDDGLREFKEFAWPLLKKYNIPVTLFVNPAFVDNKQLFFRFKASLLIDKVEQDFGINFKAFNELVDAEISNNEQLIDWIKNVSYKEKGHLDKVAGLFDVDYDKYLQDVKPYLTLNELKELHNEGVNIGAHSLDHPLFSELNIDEQVRQVEDSMLWVKDNLGDNNYSFSFPFTDFGLGKELFEKIYSIEDSPLNISFGTAGIKKDSIQNHIQRIPMENNIKSAKQIVHGEYSYFLLKALFLKNTIRRK